MRHNGSVHEPTTKPTDLGSESADAGRVELESEIRRLANAAKDAARQLATLPTETKNAVLQRAADLLEGEAAASILAANNSDYKKGTKDQLSPALLDRLQLTQARLESVANGVRQIAALPDPVGTVEQTRVLDNGLKISRMRIPLGVIAIIYESRPNVTADAAALCIKSGNAVVLRGGREAFDSNRAIANVFDRALREHDVPTAAATLLPTVDRRATEILIGLHGIVDLVIPRGGEGLIRFVSDRARVPVIQHYKGVCHVFVDRDADLDAALRIALNAKTQRPGVCNAMETLLVDEPVAAEFLPRLAQAMSDAGVELRGDAATRQHCVAKPATTADWDAEYLDLVLAVAVVSDFDAAVSHVADHGSHHTEAIITEDAKKAERWLREVDASLVLVNASTRFNDGFQLGLGAEMGISTTKLHAYGPMGLQELCTMKWIGQGQGQIRN